MMIRDTVEDVIDGGPGLWLLLVLMICMPVLLFFYDPNVGVRAGFTRFDGWSNIHAINNKAGLAARQSQANSAREVAAKALVNNKAGRPADVVCRCGPVCLPRLLPQAAAHPPCEPDHP